MIEVALNVLLVEDNPGDARLVREALAEAGDTEITLSHAESLTDALARLRDESFDVVLLDLGLPDADGLNGLRQIQDAAPRIPVLVLTGNDDPQSALSAIKAGAQDYVAKEGLKGSDLSRAVRYVLGRHRTLNRQTDLLNAVAQDLRGPIEALSESLTGLAQADSRLTAEARQMATKAQAVAVNLRATRESLPGLTRRDSAFAGLGSVPEILADIRRLASPAAACGQDAAAKRLQLLMVEDNPGDARLVQEALKDNPALAVEILHVKTLSQGIDLLRDHYFNVVLLDLGLPDAVGLEAVSEIHGVAPTLPVVVLTGTDDATIAIQALERGAQDYLVKGRVDGEILVRSLNYAIERQRSSNACSDLLEGIACELRRPLHNLIGYLYLTAASTPAIEGETAALLTRAIEAAFTLQAYCNGASEAARSDTMHDLDRGVLAAMSDLRRANQRRATFASEASADLLASVRRRPVASPEPPARNGLFGRLMEKIRAPKKRILIFDRDPDSRAIARHLLENLDFEVIEAAEPDEATGRLGSREVDFAILEVSPFRRRAEDNGDPCQTALASRVPLVRVSDGSDLDGGLVPQAGTEHTVTKPYTPAQLLFAIERGLGGLR